jgi:hypothetical protein
MILHKLLREFYTRKLYFYFKDKILRISLIEIVYNLDNIVQIFIRILILDYKIVGLFL